MLIRLSAGLAGASWGAEEMAVLLTPTADGVEDLVVGYDGIFTGEAGLCNIEAGDCVPVPGRPALNLEPTEATEPGPEALTVGCVSGGPFA